MSQLFKLKDEVDRKNLKKFKKKNAESESGGFDFQLLLLESQQ